MRPVLRKKRRRRTSAETRRRKVRDWHAKLDAVSLLFVALLFTVSLSFEKTAVT